MGKINERKLKCDWYAFTRDGGLCGIVVEELCYAWRVELFNEVQLIGEGQLVESGEIRDLPKATCRVFNDHAAFFSAITTLLRELERESHNA